MNDGQMLFPASSSQLNFKKRDPGYLSSSAAQVGKRQRGAAWGNHEKKEKATYITV